MNSINFTCIAAFILCLSIKCIFFWTFCPHTHTHNFSFSCPHALTACLRTERDCVLLIMCNLNHRSTAESHCLCQKTWMMMSELEPVCTTIHLWTFLCACISVAMSTIGDKILDTALSKVEIHLQFYMSLLQYVRFCGVCKNKCLWTFVCCLTCTNPL